MHKNVRLPIAYHVIGHPVFDTYLSGPKIYRIGPENGQLIICMYLLFLFIQISGT